MKRLAIDIEAKIGDFSLSVAFESAVGITAISGASAAGKTSILNCVSGLRKADSGTIMLAEKVLFDSQKRINLSPASRSCAYVLQKPSLFPHLNVAENICFGIERLPRQIQKDKLKELLGLLKLEGLESRRVCQLSGGQIQRVAIARALAIEPEILLLDEALGWLDQELREELGAELKELSKKLSLIVLLVTHSSSEALSLADQLILIENGRLKSRGAPSKLLAYQKSSSTAGFSW